MTKFSFVQEVRKHLAKTHVPNAAAVVFEGVTSKRTRPADGRKKK